MHVLLSGKIVYSIQFIRFQLLVSLYRMVACLVIYGFLFYISDLAGNPYLSLVLMYGSDVIGCIVAWITIQK